MDPAQKILDRIQGSPRLLKLHHVPGLRNDDQAGIRNLFRQIL